MDSKQHRGQTRIYRHLGGLCSIVSEPHPRRHFLRLRLHHAALDTHQPHRLHRNGLQRHLASRPPTFNIQNAHRLHGHIFSVAHIYCCEQRSDHFHLFCCQPVCARCAPAASCGSFPGAAAALPHCVSVFSGLFAFMPNTHVKLSSALKAGIPTGILFQLLQIGYVHSQMWLTSYNAIYGSFAALPLFMLLCQIAWMLVLFGGTLCYVDQNIHSFYYGHDDVRLSRLDHDCLSIRLVTTICRRFARAETPLTATELADIENCICASSPNCLANSHAPVSSWPFQTMEKHGHQIRSGLRYSPHHGGVTARNARPHRRKHTPQHAGQMDRFLQKTTGHFR